MNDSMKVPPVFGIMASVALVLLAAFNIVGGEQVADVGKLRLYAAFDLTASAVTVILLVAGSRGLMLSKPWADEVYLVATGMLIYALLNIAGQAAETSRTILLVLVMLVLMLTLFNLIVFAAVHRPLFEEFLKQEVANTGEAKKKTTEKPPEWSHNRGAQG